MADKHFDKLAREVENGYDALKPRRDRRMKLLQAYAGPNYDLSYGLTPAERPVNMLHMAVSIYRRKLAPQEPAVSIHTTKSMLRWKANDAEQAVNHLLADIGFEKTLQICVQEALVSLGVCKVGMTSAFKGKIEGEEFHVGQPYADPVLFDDWFHNKKARRWEEIDCCGNWYDVPVDEIKDREDFDQDALKAALQKHDDRDLSRMAGEDKRAEDLSRNQAGGNPYNANQDDEYCRRIRLGDVWVPRERVLYTYARGGTKPLKVQEWTGPRNGPYRHLALGLLQSNLIPPPPAEHWESMDDTLNRMYCKLRDQAAQQKENLMAPGSATDDAVRLAQAMHGEVIRTQNPDLVKKYSWPGPDQGILAFAHDVRQMLNYLMGNIDTLAGLDTMAGTLGQEEILVKSASESVQDMQSIVSDFIRDVATDLLFYLWTDPFIQLPLTKRIEGVGSLDTGWPHQEDLMGMTHDVRKGSQLNDYNLRVEPYSMQQSSPAARLQFILSLWERVFLPSAQVFIQQGIVPDMATFIRLVAKYSNLPEMLDILKVVDPTDLGPVEEPGTKPPNTNRKYTRVSLSGGPTKRGAENSLVNTLPRQRTEQNSANGRIR